MLLRKKRLSDEGRLLFTGRDIEEGEIPIRFDPALMQWLPLALQPIDEIGLTESQEAILRFMAAQGRATLGEVAGKLQKTRSNTSNMLSRMVDSGLLVKDTRGIYLTGPRFLLHSRCGYRRQRT